MENIISILVMIVLILELIAVIFMLVSSWRTHWKNEKSRKELDKIMLDIAEELKRKMKELELEAPEEQNKTT